MKVYLKIDQKVNFVDENNVFLGYDLDQNCCEDADWFIADTRQTTVQARSTDDPDLEGFVFDPSFFMEVSGLPSPTYSDKETSMVIFRIVKGDQEKFIHLFNTHNGYYLHGFTFDDKGTHEGVAVHRAGKI